MTGLRCALAALAAEVVVAAGLVFPLASEPSAAAAPVAQSSVLAVSTSAQSTQPTCLLLVDAGWHDAPGEAFASVDVASHALFDACYARLAALASQVGYDRANVVFDEGRW